MIDKSKVTFVIMLLLTFLISQESKAQTPDSTAADSVLLRQIEQQMGADQPAAPTAQPRSAISSNPEIGVVGDFRAAYMSRGNRNIDAYLNETEVSLQSVVDPYIRADFFVSMSRDPVTHEYGIEVEEGYLTSLSLPAGLQLKVGKFKEAVGRINPVHAHGLPFVDMPNAYVNYFGEEGLNDEGASLSWLVPNSKFYQEVILETTAGMTEAPVFARSEGNRLLYLGHFKNFFTLNDNSTLELGLTGISGPNGFGSITNIAAADLTYKWKPVQLNTYRSFAWQSEFYYGHIRNSLQPTNTSFGMYSFIQNQISKLWFLTGRFDYAQKPLDKSNVEKAFSLTAGWNATEFQKIELEAKTTHDNILGRYQQAWLRWIFIIGAHGAHKY